MNPYAILGGVLLLIAVAFGAHHKGVESGRIEVQSAWDAQKMADAQASKKLETEWRTKYDAAINQGSKNVQALRIAASVAGASNDSLRDTITKLNEQLATSTPETARKHAAAYQAVFAKCVREYRAMGEISQGHANDAATLEAAWPK